jgi:hypothetical protein
MKKSMTVYDPKTDQELDYGQLFGTDGNLLIELYHRDENDATAMAVIRQFIGEEGDLTDIVSNTLESFLCDHSFGFTSDIIRLYYANIGRSVTHCSIEEFWR